jgi:hypothetical protein
VRPGSLLPSGRSRSGPLPLHSSPESGVSVPRAPRADRAFSGTQTAAKAGSRRSVVERSRRKRYGYGGEQPRRRVLILCLRGLPGPLNRTGHGVYHAISAQEEWLLPASGGRGSERPCAESSMSLRALRTSSIDKVIIRGPGNVKDMAVSKWRFPTHTSESGNHLSP